MSKTVNSREAPRDARRTGDADEAVHPGDVSTDALAVGAMQAAFRASGGIGRAIRLLDLIIVEGPVRFAELEELSGLPKASLHRLLADLADERLIAFDERALTYSGGFRILEMANRIWTRSDLRVLARDQLLTLHALSGETVQIAVHAGTHVVVIDHVESTHSVRTSLSVGHQAPVYCSGIGKVMLAWCDGPTQARIIERISFARFTRHTITDHTALRGELAAISERGHAIDDEEHFLGSRCIAAPVVDAAGHAVAGISITAPTFRVERARLLRWRDPLVAAAAEISRRLAPHSAAHSASDPREPPAAH